MSNRTYVDLFNFKEAGSGAHVDIVTIEQGNHDNDNDYCSYSRNRTRLGRSTSPFRDRIQERYNRSLSPTGSPRLKRQTIPRSISPNLYSPRTVPVKPTVKTSPSKRTSLSPITCSPVSQSPVKTSFNNSLNNTVPLTEHPKSDEEIRRLRFENLILQSKVETLENENKALKEQNVSQLSDTRASHDASRDFSRDLTRDMMHLKNELDAATQQIDRLKKDNDDLTSQLYSLKVDRLEKPKELSRLAKDPKEDWTGCQADAIEHLCSENQRLRETIFDMNEQKLHVHRLMDQHQDTDGLSASTVRKRLDSCQLDIEQLSEEKNRLIARLEESKKVTDRYDKLQEDYKKSLSQISNLEAQLLKYEKDDRPTRQSDTINNLTERCTQLQEKFDNREKEHNKELQEKEAKLQNQIDVHVLKVQEVEGEIRRVSHVCDMLCQEKDNAIQTLQKQINTNAILSRSNEQLQNTVNEQSDRIRDLVYRQMRDTEVINELKNDFETLLQERNDLDEKLQTDTQLHLRRLATLREQINIARLSFEAVTNMLEHDNSLDNEVREGLLQQLAEVDTQLSSLQREILDMERMEAENTKTDLDDLTIQFLRKSEQCEELQTKLSNIEMENSRMCRKQNELESFLNDSRHANSDVEEKYEDLKRELHKKQMANDTLTTQLNKVKIKLGIMEDDRNVLEVQSRDLKQTNKQLCDNNDVLYKDMDVTKKKLHAKEVLSETLQVQVDDLESKARKLLDQISQLQKGISRSTIQIGLLNEEMKVAVNALLALNKEFDSESLEEHLEALQDISRELENLELALEKTLGGEYSLEMPLRGGSGEKISQLLQELDFCRENIEQLKGAKHGPGVLSDTPVTRTKSSPAPTMVPVLPTSPDPKVTRGRLKTPRSPEPSAKLNKSGSPNRGIKSAGPITSPGSPNRAKALSSGSTHSSSTDDFITSDSPKSWVYPKSHSSSQDFDFK